MVRFTFIAIVATVLLVAEVRAQSAGAKAQQPSQGQSSSESFSTQELEKHLKDEKVFFLDVREPKEIAELGSVPGYVNIPLGELQKRLSEVPKNKLIITL